MKNNLIWKAVGALFKKFSVIEAGIYHDNDENIISWERMQFNVGKYKIIIIAEEKGENLQELLDQAIKDDKS